MAKRHIYEDYVGEKFGKWTIENYVYLKGRMHFYCICECKETSLIQASYLLTGNSKSCVVCAPKKHGLYKSPTNRSWNGARNRCNNPNNKDYENYGGRGIKFCSEWNDFEVFIRDMGERPPGMTLDRIDNNGNYEKDNCRWATVSQQNSNQRKRKKI